MAALHQRLKRVDGVLLCVLLGAVFFLWQITQLSAYGASWDEPLHYAWGRMFLLSLRLDRSYLYLMPGNGVYYSPLFYVLTYLSSLPLLRGGLPLYQAAHVLTLFMASTGVTATAGIAYTLTGRRRTALLAALLLVGFPQFVAHAHYNPKDIPLLAIVTLSLWILLRGLHSGRRTTLLVAALLLGVSVAVKVSALLVLPAAGTALLLWILQERSDTPVASHALLFLLGCLAFVFGLIAAWPSAWGDLSLIVASVRFFLTENFWPGQELYLGSLYSGSTLPWHYIPLTFFLSTPLVTALAMVVGVFIAARSLFTPRYALLLLWILVPLGISVMPGLVRYDGIRQFFFVLPALVVLGALGVEWLLNFFAHRARAVAVVLALLICSLTYETWIIHPYEGAYRNEVARMLFPRNMDRVFALEYWGASYAQGLAWLADNASQNAEVCVPIANALILWYDFRDDLTFFCSPHTDYVLFFTRYDPAKQEAYAHLTPVFTIERMGATLLKIYDVRGDRL